MKVLESVDVSAPPEVIWNYVGDPSSYLHFISGITRWEVQGDQQSGIGARYRMLMRVRSAEIGGLIEVVEYAELADLAWSSVTGLDQRGRWRLRERPDGLTRVELSLAYGVTGSGLAGWLSERIAAPTIRGHLRRSLQQLKRLAEHDQLRDLAAQRRENRSPAA
ncbi:MAG: SRPBCC family protein [Actinomycetota bacterium]